MNWLGSAFFLALAVLVGLIVLSLIGSEERAGNHSRDPPAPSPPPVPAPKRHLNEGETP